MIKPATYFRIQHEFYEEHRNYAEIARLLNLDAETVSKWASQSDYHRRCSLCRKSKLDAFKPTILRIIAEEGWSLMRIYGYIQKQGYDGGLTILRTFVRSNSKRFPVRRTEYFTHLWLNKVMQGCFSVSELQTQVAGTINPDDVVDPARTAVRIRVQSNFLANGGYCTCVAG